MPPELRDASDPSEWLRRARSNLTRAKADRHLADVLYEDLCFDAQQATEKAAKAVLVHRQVEFAKTHAIADLLSLIERAGVVVPTEIQEAAALTRYAVETRYPGLAEDVSAEDYSTAVALAERVVRWAETIVGAPDSTPRSVPH